MLLAKVADGLNDIKAQIDGHTKIRSHRTDEASLTRPNCRSWNLL